MNPQDIFPIPHITKNTVLIKPLAEKLGIKNVELGEYSYFSSFDDAQTFFEDNVLYNFGIHGAKLKIGKYCAIAHGVRFIMSDANHAVDGVSTYPFPIFSEAWAKTMPPSDYPALVKGDITVGNDVWIGMGATIMSGVTIGNGAIIGAASVVTKDVPPYAIVGGNPATVKRLRFSSEDCAALADIAWWDWPAEHVTEAVRLLVEERTNVLW